jgi:hypothetical protein
MNKIPLFAVVAGIVTRNTIVSKNLPGVPIKEKKK